MILTKSKIKTFNKNKFLKQKGGIFNTLTDTGKMKNNSSANTTSNNSSGTTSNSSNVSSVGTPINVAQLSEDVKQNITKLNENLDSINIEESEDAVVVCKSISDEMKRLKIGKFINNLYKKLNDVAISNGDLKATIDGKKVIVNDKLSLLVYSKIIHGKVGSDWPSKKQTDLYVDTLKMKTSNKIMGKMGNMYSKFKKKAENKIGYTKYMENKNKMKKMVNGQPEIPKAELASPENAKGLPTANVNVLNGKLSDIQSIEKNQ